MDVSISEHRHIRIDWRRITIGRNNKDDDQFNDYIGRSYRKYNIRFTAHGLFNDGQVGWRFFFIGK